jgi:acetyl esterase/lipase
MSAHASVRRDPSATLAARLTAALLRRTVRRVLSPRVPIARQRRVAGSFEYLLPRPRGVVREPLRLDGFDGLRATPARREGGGAVLFLHGGGYAIGSPEGHCSLVMRIARETGRVVYAPRYRLAPEHPFPAQLEDAERALRALHASVDVDPNGWILAGDSAGGHLALGLAQRCRAPGMPMPRALVLISPWTDVSLAELPEDVDDALLDPGWMAMLRDGFAPAAQWRDPLVSPVWADFRGFPPTLIQSAGNEQLANDARRLHRAMADAGVDVDWDESPGLWHDFQLNAGTVPEARRAVERLGAFVRRHAP